MQMSVSGKWENGGAAVTGAGALVKGGGMLWKEEANACSWTSSDGLTVVITPQCMDVSTAMVDNVVADIEKATTELEGQLYDLLFAPLPPTLLPPTPPPTVSEVTSKGLAHSSSKTRGRKGAGGGTKGKGSECSSGRGGARYVSRAEAEEIRKLAEEAARMEREREEKREKSKEARAMRAAARAARGAGVSVEMSVSVSGGGVKGIEGGKEKEKEKEKENETGMEMEVVEAIVDASSDDITATSTTTTNNTDDAQQNTQSSLTQSSAYSNTDTDTNTNTGTDTCDVGDVNGKKRPRDDDEEGEHNKTDLDSDFLSQKKSKSDESIPQTDSMSPPPSQTTAQPTLPTSLLVSQLPAFLPPIRPPPPAPLRCQYTLPPSRPSLMIVTSKGLSRSPPMYAIMQGNDIYC